jgi:hypothetical protein
MWVWVYNHDSDQADWFAKVDSDTFLFPYNLKRFVIRKLLDSNDEHYFGHKLNQAHSIPVRIAGAAEFLSQRTLTSIGPVLMDMPSGPITGWTDATITKDRLRCVDRPGPFEEDSMSRCLKSIGVNAEDTLEADGREGVMIFKPEAHLSKSEGSIFMVLDREAKYHGFGGRLLLPCSSCASPLHASAVDCTRRFRVYSQR